MSEASSGSVRTVLPGLAGKAIVVTGGRSGIGRAVVEGLVSQGAHAISLDVSEPAESLLAPEAADRALELVCDVGRQAQVDAALAAATEACGRIRGLVQCAGITADSVLWKMTDRAWHDVLDVNLGGAFRVLRAVTPLLRAGGGGAVVNVSSINGLRGKFGQANYAASKAGLIALTKTAARELGAFGIRVNAVAPGLVTTPMTANLSQAFVEKAREEAALDRLTTAEDVAAAILFLLSDLARQITGATLRVDAGQYM